MVSINPDNQIQIVLSNAEQKLIMEYCQDLDIEILRKVSLSLNGTFFLSHEETIGLIDKVGSVMHQISDPTAHVLFNKLANGLRKNSPFDPSEYPMKPGEPEAIEDIKALFDNMYDTLNNVPDPEMGNLTPEQVYRLIYAEWGTEDCPIHFNKNLPLEIVNQSKLFRNARLLLQQLIECSDEPTLTAKGNLNRKFVKLMFDQMTIDEKDRSFILKYNKVINETDVRDLMVTRAVCDCAGLLRRQKKKFLVPKKKQYLVSPEKAGELYFEVMVGYLCEYNLGFTDRLDDFIGIQDTFGYTLYQVSKTCQNAKPLEDLYKQVLLPAVREDIRQTRATIRDTLFVLELRVIRPLVNLGLLEIVRRKDDFLKRIDTVKKTALFDKFIQFDI